MQYEGIFVSKGQLRIYRFQSLVYVQKNIFLEGSNILNRPRVSGAVL